jgi:hypothetical protein
MTNWFSSLGGPEFATAVIWTLAALILLVIVLVVVRLIRSMTFGTFVAGGRNRKTRLAVMDATAVDSHRRLVLVRRDDIEHLLLIGGPTDVVVEREIRMTTGRRAQSVFGADSEFEGQVQPQAPLPPLPTAPQAPPRQRAPEPTQLPPMPIRGGAPQPARQAERPAQPPRQPERAVTPVQRPARQTGARPPMRDMAPLPRSNPSRLPTASMPAAPTSPSRMSPSSTQTSNLDDALLRELEVTFDAGPRKNAPPPAEMTLDDEMTKLLGELSNNKR